MRRELVKSLILQFLDRRIEVKEKEKTEKYDGLRRELQKIWDVGLKITSLVVGPLGAIPKQFGGRLKETGITAEIGTARILRKFIEI